MTQRLGPAPDGRPLEMRVECRTSRTASRGKQHSIVIEHDWMVRTPHDLEAERVAAAFGGFTSCLELVDKVIPTVQTTLPLLLRRELARLTRTRGERVAWRADPVRGCRCERNTFPSAQEAATHMRSPGHLVRQHAISLRPLTKVLDAVDAAWGGFGAHHGEAPMRAARRVVSEFKGAEALWAAGLHPERVLEFAALAAGNEEPLPEAFFLGVAYSGVDVEWLAATLARRPDPSGAAWLAWVPADESEAHLNAVQDWFAHGLSRAQIEALVGEGVTIAEAQTCAEATGRSLRTVGGQLASWALAGCRPTPEHMKILARYGRESFPPPRAAVDRLLEIAAGHRLAPSRTELGVLLSLEGTQRAVEVQLERGVRSVAELVDADRRTAHGS